LRCIHGIEYPLYCDDCVHEAARFAARRTLARIASNPVLLERVARGIAEKLDDYVKRFGWPGGF
jgi:hypothetical protein